MSEGNSLSYRPDIDGLRALAVVSVIGYHAAPGIVRGGYIGVDVFFIISGFLISSIILRTRDAGRFSLIDFYARRVRRLFPALAIVLVATWLIGWFYLLPHEFRALGKHIAAGAAYFINFALKRESGYFDGAADEKPLLHLWSLAVEEQFYIVWPLLLLLVRERRTLVLVISVLVAASFVGQLLALGKNQASAFYLPQYRVWELGGGALLAMVVMYGRGRVARVLAGWRGDLASVAGVLLVLGAATLLAEQRMYPGYLALIPASGALLLIAAGPKALVNRTLLSHPVVVFVGLVSYSLYLWHWPLLSFAHILGVADDVRIVLALMALAMALACLTYLLVERPVRRAQRVTLARGLVGITIAVCAIGVLTQFGGLHPRLNEPRHQEFAAAMSDWRFPDGLQKEFTSDGLRIDTSGDGSEKILFFGDSNIQQYWPRIEQILTAETSRKAVIFATRGGCPPIPGVRDDSHPDCAGFGERGAAFAREPSIKTVVIGAAWMGYFNNSSYYLSGETGNLVVGSRAWNKGFEVLARMIGDLVADGKSVWLVLSTPYGFELSPAVAIHRTLAGGTTFKPLRMNREQFDRSWMPIKHKLLAVARSTGAHVIDPMDWLCNNIVCRGETSEGTPFYMDSGHLRASYVRDHATFMDQILGIETGSVRK